MSSEDGRGHYRAPLPVGRTPPFIVIHQEHAQVAHDLLLCAVVITPFAMDERGLTPPQAEMVSLVQSKLIGDHLAGRFPDGDDSAFWLDLTTGAMTVLDIPSDTWLRHRMRDYLTVTLNVPKPKAGQAGQ
jgi:hypothetical protein